MVFDIKKKGKKMEPYWKVLQDWVDRTIAEKKATNFEEAIKLASEISGQSALMITNVIKNKRHPNDMTWSRFSKIVPFDFMSYETQKAFAFIVAHPAWETYHREVREISQNPEGVTRLLHEALTVCTQRTFAHVSGFSVDGIQCALKKTTYKPLASRVLMILRGASIVFRARDEGTIEGLKQLPRIKPLSTRFHDLAHMQIDLPETIPTVTDHTPEEVEALIRAVTEDPIRYSRARIAHRLGVFDSVSNAWITRQCVPRQMSLARIRQRFSELFPSTLPLAKPKTAGLEPTPTSDQPSDSSLQLLKQVVSSLRLNVTATTRLLNAVEEAMRNAATAKDAPTLVQAVIELLTSLGVSPEQFLQVWRPAAGAPMSLNDIVPGKP